MAKSLQISKITGKTSDEISDVLTWETLDSLDVDLLIALTFDIKISKLQVRHLTDQGQEFPLPTSRVPVYIPNNLSEKERRVKMR